MSNQQWNSGQGSNEWAPQQDWGQQAQPQPSGQDWGQQAQPQPSGQDWGQQGAPAQDWGQQAAPTHDWGQQQAQPQPSAQDWGQQQAQPQPSGQDWGQQAASTHDWGQQPQPGADWQSQPAQPDWNQQQNWQGQPQQGQYLPAQQQFPARPVEPKGGLFDFSFKKLSLPGSAGTIFLVGTIAVAVGWLFGFINLLGSGFATPLNVIESLVSGLATALFQILVLRVLVEIGVIGTRLLTRAEEKPAKKTESPEAP
ncbi:DUF4282 domain-containing protein [Tessaracoccus coleopterorum]|uniref:DUF4282 domain-containing protein n=1 Tax=Tessaracoccus coleopterorum TaxID=2714950 RepID=UPI0018D38078|nr:DUF4282 domain-containing protein [Tessaracoccus coleopterorum]